MASDEEVRLIIKAATEQAVSNLQKLNEKMEETTKKSTSQGGALTKLKSHWMSTTAILAGAAIGFYKMTSAAMESESVEVKLAAAMKNSGTYTKERFEHLKNYAKTLQQVSTYEDEEIITAQRVLTQYKLEGQALDDTTRAVMEFASAKGMDLASAATLAGRAINGSTDSIRGLNVNLKGLNSTTERANAVSKEMTSMFGGSVAAAADTAAGRMKQAQIALGDIVETAGSLFLPMIKSIASALTSVANWFQNLSSPIQTAVVYFGVAGVALAVLTKIVLAFGVTLSAAIWPITLIAAGIAGIILAIKNWKTVMYGLEVAWNAIVYAAQVAGKFIKIVFLEIAYMATQGAANMIQPFVSAINKIIEGYNYLTNSHKELMGNIIQDGADALAKSIEQNQQELSAIQMKTTQKVQLEKDANAAVIEDVITTNDQLTQIDTEKKQSEYDQLMESLNKKYAAAKGYTAKIVKLDTDYFKFRLKSYGFDADNYTTWQTFIMSNADKNSKWQFRLWQAMSIQQTIIETYKAAVAAFSAMAGIPYVGPALGAAAAAAAVAMGMGMVAKIARTKPGNAEEGALIRGTPGSGTLLYAGERNKSEAIIPLENEEAQSKLGGLGGTVNVNFAVQYLVSDKGLPESVAKEVDKALYSLKQRGLSRAFA